MQPVENCKLVATAKSNESKKQDSTSLQWKKISVQHSMEIDENYTSFG
jgi:hypothetical protein